MENFTWSRKPLDNTDPEIAFLRENSPDHAGMKARERAWGGIFGDVERNSDKSKVSPEESKRIMNLAEIHDDMLRAAEKNYAGEFKQYIKDLTVREKKEDLPAKEEFSFHETYGECVVC
jgi:hypothetical protein